MEFRANHSNHRFNITQHIIYLQSSNLCRTPYPNPLAKAKNPSGWPRWEKEENKRKADLPCMHTWIYI